MHDLLNKVFGRLTVTHASKQRRNGCRVWRCACSCGNTTYVKSHHLVNGDTKSCGCLCRDTVRAMATTHNLSQAKIYGVYRNMLKRCYRESDNDYPRYGGRGIKVCARWLGDGGFENFVADMGIPDAKMAPERKDNDKGYDPSNCCWKSRRAQARNTRRSRYVTWKGKKRLLVELAEEYGLKYKTLHARLRRGWSLADALTSAVRPHTESH